MKKRKIVFTGGGTAGHVMVNLALIPRFQQEGWETAYIGSVDGIEKNLIEPLPEVAYDAIATGKLRRYKDLRNLTDPFRVIKGIGQACSLLRKSKPALVFSKGGFVSVPVVLAAKLNRIPVVIHESDYTPGLANRIANPFATAICTTFAETAEHIKHRNCQHVGAIVREELHKGNAQRGREFCKLTSAKPVVLIMGGSLGSRKLNETIRGVLPQLLEQFQVVHLCGKGQLSEQVQHEGYRQYEYMNEQLPDVLALADVVVSRAGSNAIFEFAALQKPMLLIPLTLAQSRGDQLLNAESFRKKGLAAVMQEEQLSEEGLVSQIQRLYAERAIYQDRLKADSAGDGLERLIDVLKQSAR